jgi:ribonuclease T
VKYFPISVDIETSGPVPGKHSILAIGACSVSQQDLQFYREIQPIGDSHDPAALEVTGLNIEKLSLEGTTPLQAIQELKKWIHQVAPPGLMPLFCGLNVAFDWSHMVWYCHTFIGENPFGIAPFDIKSFWLGLQNCTWEDTRSSRIAASLGIQRTKFEEHNALADAIFQARLIGGESFNKRM